MRSSAKRRQATPEPALSRLSDVLQAIPASQVLPLSVSVPHAVATISQSLPRVRRLEARIVAELPAFDLTLLDRLPDYASALAQAHAVCRSAVDGVPAKAELFREAKNLRKQLLMDATALAGHGLIDSTVLQGLAPANGHRNVAQDLELLAAVFRNAWLKIQGRSPHTLADLAAASELAKRLLDPSPAEQAEAEHARACDLRARAFTLTQRAYREVRRAVCYLREPEGDANAFAPALHIGRPR